MFFDSERISAVREMIMAENPEPAGRALAKILPMQRKDFVGILKEMVGSASYDSSARSAAARISAAPRIRRFAISPNKIGTTIEHLNRVRQSLFENNPMLGHRGSRLGISFPEITRRRRAQFWKPRASCASTASRRCRESCCR